MFHLGTEPGTSGWGPHPSSATYSPSARVQQKDSLLPYALSPDLRPKPLFSPLLLPLHLSTGSGLFFPGKWPLCGDSFLQHLRICKRDQYVCPAGWLSHRQATVHIKVLRIALILLEFRESGFWPSLSSPNPCSVLKLIPFFPSLDPLPHPRHPCFCRDSRVQAFNSHLLRSLCVSNLMLQDQNSQHGRCHPVPMHQAYSPQVCLPDFTVPESLWGWVQTQIQVQWVWGRALL